MGQSTGAPMPLAIHIGDIQIDTPVYERRYVTLHFSKFFKTSDCQKVVQTKVIKMVDNVNRREASQSAFLNSFILLVTKQTKLSDIVLFCLN